MGHVGDLPPKGLLPPAEIGTLILPLPKKGTYLRHQFLCSHIGCGKAEGGRSPLRLACLQLLGPLSQVPLQSVNPKEQYNAQGGKQNDCQ